MIRRKSKLSKKPKLNKQHSKLYRLSVFALIFAAISGGIFLYTTRAAVSWVSGYKNPHGASCTANSPKKTIVRPNEQFSVAVSMKNVGTSTWSPSYGFFLSEYSTNIQGGTSIWKAKGGTFTGSVAPGATKNFSLSVTAPSQTGSYPMAWGMHVVFKGFVYYPCAAKTIKVMNPPVVTLRANDQNSNITVTKGSKLILKWTSTNDTKRCIASGSWSGDKTPAPGGSDSQTSDTSTTGTKTYTLTCYNALLIGVSATRKVTVVNPPSSSSSGGSSTGGSSLGGTSSGGTSSGGSSSGSSSSTETKPDKTAPSVPTEFSANIIDDSTVSLSWLSSTDNVSVKGYNLERSTDKRKWEKLGDDILIDQYFEDITVKFETTYHYRLRAVDEAGNKSKYAQVSVTTNPFNANVKPDEATSLTSENGMLVVDFPIEALTQPAVCSLNPNDSVLAPEVDGQTAIAGPIDVLCKQADGVIINSFAQPVHVSIKLNEEQQKDLTTLSYHTYGGEWQQVGTDNPLNIAGFDLTDRTTFAVMAANKSLPLWQKILIGLAITAVIIGGVLLVLVMFLRLKQRRQYQKKYQDYYRKERGY